MATSQRDVCFTPESGHLRAQLKCPLSAKSRLMHRNMISAKRKTANAAVSPKSEQVF
jgi:hypothetical protein